MAWSVEATSARFRVPIDARGQWIYAWAEADDRSTLRGGLREFSLPFVDWVEFGTTPAIDADVETVDQWRSRHVALAQLLEVPNQCVKIATVGHIGAPDVTFQLTVDEQQIADAATPTPFPNDGWGAFPLTPVAFIVHERLSRWNLRRSATRPQQLVFVGELRDHLERARTILDGSPASITFELDPHLGEFRTRRVDRVAMGWKPQKNAAVLDLDLEEVAEDGTRSPLDLRNLDPDSPMIAVSSTESIILDENVEAVARVAKKQKNKLRKAVERHFASPATLIPEGVSLENIDLSQYSPRVAGFAPIIKADRFIDIQSSGTPWYTTDGKKSDAFLEYLIAQPGTGQLEKLTIATHEEAKQVSAALDSAITKEPGEVVNIGGQRVQATPAFADRVRQDLENHDRRQAGTEQPAKPVRLAAVISEDVETPAVARELPESPVAWDVVARALAPGFTLHGLKGHQRDGVEWMWRHYKHGRPGVLLADDMGLGKTLQISLFLALQRTVDTPTAPTLIVCPVILLKNWQDEIRKFFQGDAFEPMVVLYDEGLRKRRVGDRLDTTDLRTAAYVLTNYETLQAYQQSLLTIDWNVVVLDEAHKIKNPDTYTARAARGLKRRFAIAATGTPVENRLGDLWSLYDFLSPGNPFTSVKDFEKAYESDLEVGIERVRAALSYPSQRSTLMRRTKDQVLELKGKTEKVHHITMTPEQMSLERSVTSAASRGAKGGIFRVLQDLQKLYQHPRLLDARKSTDGTIATLLEQSPKLRLTMDILREIRSRGEKALVFTLWTDMQDLLVRVIAEEVGLPSVRVINGDPKQRKHALAYIKEFSDKAGFNVLVLSPLAAGTGLTITAANHVIHYGRWWNPAKEDQATDRAYRIGQDKPVTVHYPLLTHPAEDSLSFDVNLHNVVERKRAMAKDFLMPAPETVTEEDLASLGKG